MAPKVKPKSEAPDAKTRAAFDDFGASFVEALKDENDRYEKMPKVHDPDKGECMVDVDPAVADKFLED